MSVYPDAAYMAIQDHRTISALGFKCFKDKACCTEAHIPDSTDMIPTGGVWLKQNNGHYKPITAKMRARFYRCGVIANGIRTCGHIIAVIHKADTNYKKYYYLNVMDAQKVIPRSTGWVIVAEE